MQTSALHVRDFALPAGDETLAGDILAPSVDSPVHMLFLHGAGQSTRQRQRPVREVLALRGHASAAIDFSGHGDSSAVQPNSLSKRLDEAQALLDRFTTGPRTVVGVSMSGEIAMRLACRPENHITHLVTLVGAIYDGAAFALPFGPDFSAALRRPGSWRDAHVLEAIRAYPGHITLVRGQDDAVIPREVADLIRDNAVASAGCRIIDLPGVDHRLSERAAQDSAVRELLVSLIAS